MFKCNCYCQDNRNICYAVGQKAYLSTLTLCIRCINPTFARSWRIHLMGRVKQKKAPSNTRNMRWLRSSCECAKYQPGLCSPFMQSKESNDSVSGQWRPWSDCADAQADLGLRCPHMPEGTFSHGTAHIWACACRNKLPGPIWRQRPRSSCAEMQQDLCWSITSGN